MIWTEGSDRLKIFVDYLNNIHPTIKFTSSHSLTNVPFLDVMVSLHNGIIETDLFTKPTDKHQHLLSSSYHPHHTKKAIPFSLALRLRRICSTDAKFKHRINKLKTYLLARGYNNNFLEEQFLRAANLSRTNALQTKPKDSNDVVPFVVTYNLALPRISNFLRKHFNILHTSNRCKDVFKQPPFVAYRRSPNLRDILVKARLPVISNNHFPLGSFRCGQNCATCPYITVLEIKRRKRFCNGEPKLKYRCIDQTIHFSNKYILKNLSYFIPYDVYSHFNFINYDLV